MPRTSKKRQVLADLVAEFTEPEMEELPLVGNMDENWLVRFPNIVSRLGKYMWTEHRIKKAQGLG